MLFHRIKLFVLIVVSSAISCVSFAGAETINVPADFGSIGEAVGVATDGDTIVIGPGIYREEIDLRSSINLIGMDPERCVIRGVSKEKGKVVITVHGNSCLSGLTIMESSTGVHVKSGAFVRIENSHITGNAGDGVGFDHDFNSYIYMRGCLIAQNGDGVDLESTQGVILESRFIDNGDDGIDYDGDAGVLVYGCVFAENRDDGIEIRLLKETHAIIINSAFRHNGEDGIEIINSPLEDGDYNILCVQNSNFEDNVRFGIGFVPHGVEEHTGEMSKTAVYAAGNSFSENGAGHVSPNYLPVFEATESYPSVAEVDIIQNGETVRKEMPARFPLLVGIYNMRPTVDGLMAGDCEGVAVHRDRMFVADDSARRIYVLNKHTGAVERSIPTMPFPESKFEAPGPEGLDIVDYNGKNMLVLSDDDGESLFYLSLERENFGHVVFHKSTASIGKAEAVEAIGGRFFLAAEGNKIHAVEVGSLKQGTSDFVEYRFEGFGNHIAGIGADESGQRIFVTLSAYVKDQNWRNKRSAFFETYPGLKDIRGFWQLGPFSNDPRGIAFDRDLIFVADGRSDFLDRDTGEMNRGGQKIFVFLLEDKSEVLEQVIPLLPVRRKIQKSK